MNHTVNEIEDLFPDEIDAILSQPSPAAVIPIGCVEQHGPHLLLGCDGFITRMLARETARLGDAVLFPMVPHSWIGGLRIWPGTVDISSRSMGDYLEEVCLQALQMGFRRVMIVNAHGGGREMVFLVTRRVFRKTGAAIFAAYPAEVSARHPEIDGIWEDHGIRDRQVHEASEMTGALGYLGRPELAEKVLENIRTYLGSGPEPEPKWNPPSLERAFRVGEVGHDYLDEIRHAAPRSATNPDAGREVITALAGRLAQALADLETYRAELEEG